MPYTDYTNKPGTINALLSNLSFGATSVADGGTIAHGLGKVPTTWFVQSVTSGEVVSASVDATNITVAIKKIADGSAGTTATLPWLVRAAS